MKNVLKLSLGILTSIAGFLEAGSLGTSLQAGASFRFGLLWPIALGAICIAFLTEMSGRLAAVSRHTIVSATRERFGFRVHAVVLFGHLAVDFLVLGAEIGGVSLALQFATGIDLRVWAVPVALGIWFLLWRGRFSLVENGVAVLGLVTLSFVIAAFRLGPPAAEVTRGLLPHLPGDDRARYLFLAVSILGATISPYLISFYSSGAVEERWRAKDLAMNRITAWGGMAFGCVVSIAVVVVAACTLFPRGVQVETFADAAGALTPAFERWGFALFVATLGVGCFGAAIELALDMGYITSQALGWTWGENRKPREAARFSLVYTVALLAATTFTLVGIDPLRLTLISMAVTVLVLPLPIAPLLVVMNDAQYVGRHRNHLVTNFSVIAILGLAALLALVAIPLQIAESS